MHLDLGKSFLLHFLCLLFFVFVPKSVTLKKDEKQDWFSPVSRLMKMGLLLFVIIGF